MTQRRAVVVFFICGVVACFFNLAYTTVVDNQSDRDNQQNDRKWCRLLVELDDAYKGATPTTQTGRNVAQAIHELRTDLGC